MKQTIHFMQTPRWYQYLTSTAYNEMEFKEWDIIEEASAEVSEEELNKLQSDSWQQVRENIKNKIKELLGK